eukprot:4033586-Ditylum_brightwellii.AAC.1
MLPFVTTALERHLRDLVIKEMLWRVIRILWMLYLTLIAVDSNTDDLPDADIKDKYSYEMWPETFDSILYRKARPVPKVIMTEFDCQAKLSLELREKYADLDDDAKLMGLHKEG